MTSKGDTTRRGLWNDKERRFKNQNRDAKLFKRQKLQATSLVWTDESKEQSECSKTNITTKSVSPEVLNIPEIRSNKFFSGAAIEKVFMNSEYLKLKSGSVSSVSGQNGENQWMIDGRNTFNRRSSSGDVDFSLRIADKEEPLREAGTQHGEEDLRFVKENLSIMINKVMMLKRDLGSVKMYLKTIEKLTLSSKQNEAREANEIENYGEGMDLCKLPSDEKNTAQELEDFTESELLQTHPDFDKIISNMRALSQIAYEPKITKTSKGAKFQIPTEFPVTLYTDGILLRNREFRKYTDIKATMFLCDIESGFLPIELWEEYPYGVPFQVTDRRFERYNDLVKRFPGNGRRLGSTFDCKPSSVAQPKPQGSSPMCHQLTVSGRTGKIEQNAFFPQDRKEISTQEKITANNKPAKENEKTPAEADPTLMSIKVRLGNEQETLRINAKPNEKMKHFRDFLLGELCGSYRDRQIKEANLDGSRHRKAARDFEVHVYGQKPFRLSESLDRYPSECGIVNNCVVNVTEI